MARRVNKKFVLILGLALLGVGGASALLGLYLHRHPYIDPKVMVAMGDKAEKGGDLKSALDFYRKAADASKATHAPNVDQLYLHIADLCMTMSQGAKNVEEGSRYYDAYAGALQAALTENPRNREVLERQLEEQYQSCVNLESGNSKAWNDLTDEASRYIALQTTPTIKPLLYRAEARLNWARLVTTIEVPENHFKLIEDDLKKARELDPNAGKPVALMGELLNIQARLADTRGDMASSRKLDLAMRQLLGDFLKQHPNDPDVVHSYSIILATRGDLGSAIEYTEGAFKANPGNRKLGQLLASFYQADQLADASDPDLAPETKSPPKPAIVGNPAKAEQVCKDLIAAHPDSAEDYYVLAYFYQTHGRTKDSIAAYKDCVAHAGSAGGIEASRIRSWLAGSYEFIAWQYLDLAESDRVETPAGTADLSESAKYIEKFRSAFGIPGVIDMLNGRIELLKGNIPQAVKLLHQAEAGLGNAPELQERLRKTKLLLARANLQLPQLGAALEDFDQALKINPRDVLVILERAEILNQLKKYAEARDAMTRLLNGAAVLPSAVIDEAHQILATAEYGLGNVAASTQPLENIETVSAMLQLANTQLIQGDYDAAVSTATRVLEKEPTNTEAENLQAIKIEVVAYMQLNKRDQAAAEITRAMVKYPKNADLEVLNEQLKNPVGTPVQQQTQVISAISDEFLKQMQFSLLYRRQHDTDKEIAALQAAEATVTDADSAEGRQKLDEVLDRIFSASSQAAYNATDEAVKTKYWAIANTYVQRAEKLDADGVGGKLYRGRYEIMMTKGASGLQLIELAVQQRPDFAYGHSLLGWAYTQLTPPRYDRAAEEFRQAIHLVPNNVNFLRAAIELLIDKTDSGSREETKNYLEQALAYAPSDPGLAQLNDRFAELNRSELPKAIANREAMLKANPKDLSNIRRLAVLYVSNKDKDPKALDKAAELLKPIAEGGKADLGTVGMLAAIYGQQQDVGAGVKLFDPYILSPDVKVKYQALLMLGEFYKSVRKIDQAVSAFEDAIKIEEPGNDEAHRHLGDLYFDTEDLAKAVSIYKDILEKAPQGVSRMVLLRRLIETEIRLGDFASADKSLTTEVLAKDPNDVQGLLLQAFSKIKQGRAKEALADVNRILAKDASNTDALYYRALAQVSFPEGDVHAAISDLLSVEDKEKTDKSLKADLLLTQIYRQTKRYGGAAAEYAEILARRPDMYAVRRDYASFLFDLLTAQTQLTPGATDPFSFSIISVRPAEMLDTLLAESLKLYPEQGIWLLMRADLYTLQGKLQDADNIYQRIYEAVPEDPYVVNAYLKSLLKAANEKDQQDKYAQVVTVATKLIDKRQDLLDIYVHRADAYAHLQKTHEAIADFDHAFAIGAAIGKQTKDYSQYLEVMNVAARTLAKQDVIDLLSARIAAGQDETIGRVALVHMLVVANKPADVLPVIAAIKLPEDNKDVQVIGLSEIGMAYYLAKDYPNAQKTLSQEIALAPNDMGMQNNLAFMLADNMHRPKEAIPVIENAIKILEATSDPATYLANACNIYDTYGWVKYRNGDPDGAIIEFRKSLVAKPTGITYLHMAQVFKDSKKTKEALDILAQGIHFATESKDSNLAQLQALQRN